MNIWLISNSMIVKANTPIESKPDWSKADNTCPDWFRDAKFGIYCHWGPYCVPEFEDEWYSRRMYQKDSVANLHHTETYGPLSEFGYKDFFGQFTGEHFNADEWVRLMMRGGAKYIAVCAEHADNFSMWPSRVNPVNSMNYGPRRDVVGEMKTAAGHFGVPFGATLHHSWLWGWYCSTDPSADVYNPQNEMFYGKPQPVPALLPDPPLLPDDSFNQVWLEKCKEVIDGYLPDMIYFDSRVHIIEEKYRLAFIDYYYKAARKAGKEVVFTYKFEDFPAGTGILDFESNWQHKIRQQPWQNDDMSAWNTWCYVKDIQYKTSTNLIHQLVDDVSKNGNFLLNLCPRTDGTFTPETIALVEAIGDWLQINGEGIYGSHPFTVFGEGPTEQIVERILKKPQYKPFTAEDIRFTQKGASVYAILLGWPHAGKISISSLRKGGVLERPIHRITMLGDGNRLSFEHDTVALTVTLPGIRPCKDAWMLKIE